MVESCSDPPKNYSIYITKQTVKLETDFYSPSLYFAKLPEIKFVAN